MKQLIKLTALAAVASAALGLSACYCKKKVEPYVEPAVVTTHHHHKLEKVKHEHVHK